MVINLTIIMLTDMLQRYLWVPCMALSKKDITITEVALHMRYIDIGN